MEFFFQRQSHPNAWCCTLRVVERLAPFGEQSLYTVTFRHFPLSLGKELFDMFVRGFVEFQFYTRKFCENFPCEIILCGSQSTGNENQFRSANCGAKDV